MKILEGDSSVRNQVHTTDPILSIPPLTSQTRANKTNDSKKHKTTIEKHTQKNNWC